MKGSIRRRDKALARLGIGHPVDEEDDVAGFLIHQGFEDGEHLLGQEFRLHRDLEDAEAQKGIHAFAEAEILEAGFDIVGDVFQRAFGGIDAVFLDHHPDHLGVAGFFQALQRHGFFQHRIGDGFGEGGDDRPGPALGIENLFPERHGFQALSAPPRPAPARAACRDQTRYRSA